MSADDSRVLPLDPRRRRNVALEVTAQDCMRVVAFLRRMRHRALEHQLALDIPADKLFLDLMTRCAALKHEELETRVAPGDAEHP